MSNIVNNIMLFVEIIAIIGCILYMWSTTMAYNRVKKVFTCKKCEKMNRVIQRKCIHCGHDMTQWVGKYITFLRVVKDCCNKHGEPEFKITKRYIIKDIIML